MSGRHMAHSPGGECPLVPPTFTNLILRAGISLEERERLSILHEHRLGHFRWPSLLEGPAGLNGFQDR